MRVFVVGAASWDTIVHLDRLPTTPGTVFARSSYDVLGGTAAGKALNLARLGHEVHLHTVLGDDDAGARVRAELEAAGVQLLVDQDAERTEQHVNLMITGGDRLSIYRSAARPRHGVDARRLADLAETCEQVVLNITDYVHDLVPELVRRGVPFWTDLHDWDGHDDYHRDFLAASSVVLSDERLGDRAGDVCAGLARPSRLVVCTHGVRGATAWRGDRAAHVASRPVAEVVDTNGAGDAFTAGVIHGLGLGWPLPRALEAGAVAGATAVTVRTLAADTLTPALLEAET